MVKFSDQDFLCVILSFWSEELWLALPEWKVCEVSDHPLPGTH